MIDKNISLVNKVIEEIISEICCGDIDPGENGLPSEAELTQRYGISRATLRDALTKLEYGGAIVRRHGVGTYLSPMATNHRETLRSWFVDTPNFLYTIETNGYEPGCSMVSCSIIPAGPSAEYLKLQPDAEVLYIERVFLASGIPAIHSCNYISIDLAPLDLREAVCSSFKCETSTYELLGSWGTWIDHHKSEVRAVLAGKGLAALFECDPGDPVLHVDQVFYNSKLEPLFFAVNSFRGDLASFVQMRNPMVSLGMRK
jgi:GntR family transcriptional regulator